LQEPVDRPYVAYMLRIWQSEGPAGTSLRASLEDARSGERQSFRDLDALCIYLREHVEGTARRPLAEAKGGGE
jgi:hypothetical protein